MNQHLGKYDHIQIITEDELKAFARELIWQQTQTPWYRPVLKWSLGVSAGVLIGLLDWLKSGKGGIKNSGGDPYGIF